MLLIKWNTAQVQGLIAGSLLLVSPTLADQGGIFRWVPVAAGGALLFTLPSRTHSREEDDDFFAYLKAGWDAATQGAIADTKLILADTAPPKITRWVESMASTFAEPLDLFKQLHKKSFLVVAESDGGKTWFMHQSVLLSCDEKDQILILDKSYGKRGWDWWSLPVGKTVFKFNDNCPENLPNLLHTAYGERERRKFLTEQAAEQGKPTPSFGRFRLYITEWNQTYAAYGQCRDRALAAVGKDNADSVALPPIEDIDFWVSELLFDGHGYNMLITLEVHSAAVGRSKIDQSQQSQVNWVLLGTTAVKVSELAKLLPNAKDWVPRVQAARALPGMSRVGIAIIRGTPHLYNPLPYGDGLILPEETEQLGDVEQWLELRKPDVITYLSNNHKASPSSTFDQISVDFPQGHKNRKEDNPYWQALKTFVNQYKEENQA